MQFIYNYVVKRKEKKNFHKKHGKLNFRYIRGIKAYKINEKENKRLLIL